MPAKLYICIVFVMGLISVLQESGEQKLVLFEGTVTKNSAHIDGWPRNFVKHAQIRG